MTPPEKRMWKFMENRPSGYIFVPQQPIGPFFVDFYCDELKLAVEVDGKYHETQREKDAQRTKIINSLGVRVVRFSAADCFSGAGMSRFKQHLKAMRKRGARGRIHKVATQE